MTCFRKCKFIKSGSTKKNQKSYCFLKVVGAGSPSSFVLLSLAGASFQRSGSQDSTGKTQSSSAFPLRRGVLPQCLRPLPVSSFSSQPRSPSSKICEGRQEIVLLISFILQMRKLGVQERPVEGGGGKVCGLWIRQNWILIPVLPFLRFGILFTSWSLNFFIFIFFPPSKFLHL